MADSNVGASARNQGVDASLDAPTRKATTAKSPSATPTKKSTAQKSTGKESTNKKTTNKKTTNKKTTNKKTTNKKTTNKKTTNKKTTNKKTTNKKTTNKKTTGSQTSTSTRGATLRSELKKFAGESYETGELLRGALIIVEREGADAVRAAVMALVASKIPLAGNELAKSAADPLIRQLTDDYKKLNAADRRAVRGALNWLTGAFEVDSRTTNDLVRTLNAAQPVQAAALSAPLPAEPRLEALAQGFVLPPKG